MDPSLDFTGYVDFPGPGSPERRRRIEGSPGQDPASSSSSSSTQIPPVPSTFIVNIDNSYAQIHRSIDEAFGTIIGHMPAIMEKVRQNNQTVVDKLVSYEHEFQMRSSSEVSLDSLVGDETSSTLTRADYDWLLDYMSSIDDTPPSAAGTERESSNPATSEASAPAGARALRASRQGVGSHSSGRGVYNTPPDSTSHSERGSVAPSKRRQRPNNTPPTPATGMGDGPTSPSDSGVAMSDAPSRKQRRSHGFADKFWQIASPDAEDRVREFAQRYRMTHDDSSSQPHCLQFLATTQITDGTKFLRMLPCLAFAIEYNTFEELKHRVQKRIALAHFYHAYTLAQQNPETFLAWCDEQPFRQSMLPNGGYKSIVLQRFADLMFPSTDSSTLSRHSSNSKARIGKIQTWRKLGKPWAKIIKQFGYGILLLVPPNLTDEDLRLTVDEELARILRLAETQKHRFSGPLQQADELIRKCLFEQECSTNEWPDMAMLGEGDWNALLQSSQLPN